METYNDLHVVILSLVASATVLFLWAYSFSSSKNLKEFLKTSPFQEDDSKTDKFLIIIFLPWVWMVLSLGLSPFFYGMFNQEPSIWLDRLGSFVLFPLSTLLVITWIKAYRDNPAKYA